MNRPIDESALRIPPHNIGAEQNVIGALLLEPAALAKVSDWLAEGDFYRRDHGLIYACIRAMAEAGNAVDVFTVAARLADDVDDDHKPDDAYIVELANTTPSAANVVAYAEIVLERSRLRQVIDAAHRMSEAAFSGRSASADIVAGTIHTLADVSTEHRGGL